MLLAAFDQASRGGDHGPRFLFPLLLILLLSLLFAKIIRRRRGDGMHSHRHGSPMQTLQDRFARGEIDRAEFEHRKAVLDGSDIVPPAPARTAPTQSAPPSPPAPPAPEGETAVADTPESGDEE